MRASRREPERDIGASCCRPTSTDSRGLPGTTIRSTAIRCSPPAYPGEALSATVAITRLRADKELANLATRVLADDGRVVCDGEALVLVRNLENKGR